MAKSKYQELDDVLHSIPVGSAVSTCFMHLGNSLDYCKSNDWAVVVVEVTSSEMRSKYGRRLFRRGNVNIPDYFAAGSLHYQGEEIAKIYTSVRKGDDVDEQKASEWALRFIQNCIVEHNKSITMGETSCYCETNCYPELVTMPLC